jgi:hypothetical protein
VNIIWNSSEDKPKADKPTNSVLPEGTYTAEIVKSVARQSQFDNVKTPDNPEGWEWSLWLDVHENGTRYRVFDSIAVTRISRINEVLRATGRPELRPGKDHRVDETSLEGETVRIRVYISKAGKARVGEYMKAEAAPSKPAKTKVQVDDIPF